jgi:hypothetical protein
MDELNLGAGLSQTVALDWKGLGGSSGTGAGQAAGIG